MSARLPLTLAAALLVVVGGCGGGQGRTGDAPAGDHSGSPADDAPASTEPAPPNPRLGMPKAGSCYRMSPERSRDPVAVAERVACRSAHTTVVARVAVVPGAITEQTPRARREAVARKLCEPAFRRVAGGRPPVRAGSLLTWAFFTPSAEQLDGGARWVRCDVLARSGRELVPLPSQQPLLDRGLPEALRVCQDRQGRDVSCARPHVFRVEATFRADGARYPGAEFRTVARDRCKQLMGGYGGYWQPPSRTGWAAGDRFVRCLARTG